MNDIDRRVCWHEVRNELYMEDLNDWPQGLPLPAIAWLERCRYSDSGMGRKRYCSFVSLLKSEIEEGRLVERGDTVEIRRITTKQQVEKVNVRTILAKDVAHLLRGADLGRHLSAWLAPFLQHDESTKPKGDDSDSPGSALERILAECERRATKAGEIFDVNDMPGQIAQFWRLCQQLEPVFKRQTNIESFKRYTKAGRCK